MTVEQQASEIVTLARDVPDVGLELLGLRLRVIARLERGDLVAARRDTAEFERLVERLRQPFFSWYAVLTTHYLEEAEQLCREVAIINKGEIIKQGSVKSLLTNLNSVTLLRVDVRL